ncbi:hypothetical protein GIX82_04250 [Lactobacillus reuteri]|nr:hypothetical protein [Limosilactobacillus reuteri]
MSKVITRFKVYEDDWPLRQHKEPMEFGLEDWLNQLAKKYDKVEVVGFQHGQSNDTSHETLTGEVQYEPYETLYVIAKVIKYA